tara:strand:- start:1069 stop:1452 length:384 start_codon:yes stop_codon:yes gene_type:complete
MTTNFLILAARICIPSVFIALGIERIMVYLGIITGPEFSMGTIAFSAFELAVGLMVAFGWKLRFTAGLLAIFIILDAFISHPFWSVSSIEFHAQYLHFSKNLSAFGGLILLIWFDIYSLDKRKEASE